MVSNSVWALPHTRNVTLEAMDEYRLSLQANETVRLELEEG